VVLNDVQYVLQKANQWWFMNHMDNTLLREIYIGVYQLQAVVLWCYNIRATYLVPNLVCSILEQNILKWIIVLLEKGLLESCSVPGS
jgi:hypothetical protein